MGPMEDAMNGITDLFGRIDAILAKQREIEAREKDLAARMERIEAMEISLSAAHEAGRREGIEAAADALRKAIYNNGYVVGIVMELLPTPPPQAAEACPLWGVHKYINGATVCDCGRPRVTAPPAAPAGEGPRGWRGTVAFTGWSRYIRLAFMGEMSFLAPLGLFVAGSGQPPVSLDHERKPDRVSHAAGSSSGARAERRL